MTLRVRDIPNSYQEAEKLLNKDGCRKISKNGWLLMSPEIMERCVLLKLFNTVIVRYYPDGSMLLKHEGHITKTTQMWMNAALGRFGNTPSLGYIDRDIKNREMIYREPVINAGYYGVGQILPCLVTFGRK